ncbi:MAG TPA: phosphosulfolactate synthase, partial [Gaiellaceae bacterium]|nr:phosphosulfolactate synthase [Gaiellaceae bacterium]
IDFHDLVWEAPTKASQAWFVKHFGPDVNLGNIPPDEVIALETLRLGLRGDTLKEVLPGAEAPLAAPPSERAGSGRAIVGTDRSTTLK